MLLPSELKREQVSVEKVLPKLPGMHVKYPPLPALMQVGSKQGQHALERGNSKILQELCTRVNLWVLRLSKYPAQIKKSISHSHLDPQTSWDNLLSTLHHHCHHTCDFLERKASPRPGGGEMTLSLCIYLPTAPFSSYIRWGRALCTTSVTKNVVSFHNSGTQG